MMSQATQVVTLRWEEAGEESLHKLHDIQPDGSGKIDWTAVEKDFRADLVRIAGGTTPAVFNQEDASKGLTRDFFQPGTTLLVTVMRKAPGGSDESASRQLDILRKLDQVLAERSSVTRQASKISEVDLRSIMNHMKCTVAWQPGDPSLDDLLGATPEEGGVWNDEAAEPTPREMYSDRIKKHIPKRKNRLVAFELRDMTKWKPSEIKPPGAHKLAGKADELIVLRSYHGFPTDGAVMGVEVKKRLAWRTILQVQAEYLLYATQSNFPFCMVATDFERGGIAMYYTEDAMDTRVIAGRVFKGMESFWRFFTQYLSSLPEDLGTSKMQVVHEVSADPKRRRLTIPLEGSPRQHMQDALQQLASFYNGLGDVANLDDLHGFPELGPRPELVSPCNPPGVLELPSHGSHELGRGCPPYIT